MKSFKLYLSSLLLILTLGFVGCSDDFDMPPANIPHAEKQANTTIAELKKAYWQDGGNYVTPVDPGVIIKGRVISSDLAGNVYKQLYIQDETAAICISINQNSLYTNYRVGQEIVLDLSELHVGKFAGLIQVGAPDEKDPAKCGRISNALFEKSAELNGLPELKNVDTLSVTISDLPSDPEGLQKFQCQLVRFDNVKWEDAGKPFCDEDANAESGYKNTSRYFVDANGQKLQVRNSGYANFKGDILPEGEGSVVGILSYFNGNWQVLLRTKADLIDFTPASSEGGKDDPYTVDEVITLQGKASNKWMKGFIVGAVAPGAKEVKTNEDVQWEAPTVLANTIVLAPAADVKDVTKCVIVALNEGTDLRNVANLKDNKVLGKEILIKGVFENFMGQAGVTTSGAADDFVLEGVVPAGDVLDIATKDPKAKDMFTIENKVCPTELGQVWKFDQYGVKATAHVGGKDGTNYATEAWLVTKELNIDGQNDLALSFDHKAGFFKNIKNECTVLLSVDGGEFTQVAIPNYPEMNNTWPVKNSGEIKVPAGKTLKVAFKYTSTTQSAGTWEIVRVMVKKSSGEVPPTPPTPTPGEGDGTEAKPFTVDQVIGGAAGNGQWVKGVIVGYIEGMNFDSGATFGLPTGPDAKESNLLLAPSADVKDASKCIPIQLPYGAIRTALGLVTNPGNLGKTLEIKGNIMAYFGKNGVKEATEFKLNGEGGGVTPPTPTPTGAIFNAAMTTADSYAKFTIDNKVMPAELKSIWSQSSTYGAKASAFDGAAKKGYASESWLITPELNIAGYNNIVLKFDQAANFYKNGFDSKVLVSIDGGAFTEVAIPTPPAGNSWNFGSSGDIKIGTGSKLKIAFKYTSTAAVAGTWEIKNIVVDGTK